MPDVVSGPVVVDVENIAPVDIAHLLGGNAKPLDVPLPEANSWSIEGTLPYSYHEQNTTIANQILDADGFAEIDMDGWREAPNGSDFSVNIEYASSSSISGSVCASARDSLQAIEKSSGEFKGRIKRLANYLTGKKINSPKFKRQFVININDATDDIDNMGGYRKYVRDIVDTGLLT